MNGIKKLMAVALMFAMVVTYVEFRVVQSANAEAISPPYSAAAVLQEVYSNAYPTMTTEADSALSSGTFTVCVMREDFIRGTLVNDSDTENIYWSYDQSDSEGLLKAGESMDVTNVMQDRLYLSGRPASAYRFIN